MDIIPSDGTTLGTLGAGVLASLLYLRKFLSRQNVEVSKDSAESNLIRTLQSERDKAMAAAEKAWETRAKDAQMIGELTAQVSSLRELNEIMRQQMSDMKTELHQVRLELEAMRNEASGS
jgi:hypothetical protein